MRFTVNGADRDSGEPVTILVDARDEGAAVAYANKKGILVSGCAAASGSAAQRKPTTPLALRGEPHYSIAVIEAIRARLPACEQLLCVCDFWVANFQRDHTIIVTGERIALLLFTCPVPDAPQVTELVDVPLSHVTRISHDPRKKDSKIILRVGERPIVLYSRYKERASQFAELLTGAQRSAPSAIELLTDPLLLEAPGLVGNMQWITSESAKQERPGPQRRVNRPRDRARMIAALIATLVAAAVSFMAGVVAHGDGGNNSAVGLLLSFMFIVMAIPFAVLLQADPNQCRACLSASALRSLGAREVGRQQGHATIARNDYIRVGEGHGNIQRREQVVFTAVHSSHYVECAYCNYRQVTGQVAFAK